MVGAARSSKREYVQFLYIALGSLSELETQLIIVKELNYTNDLTHLKKYQHWEKNYST